MTRKRTKEKLKSFLYLMAMEMKKVDSTSMKMQKMTEAMKLWTKRRARLKMAKRWKDTCLIMKVFPS